MAVLREALGQRREALVELHGAVAETSAGLYALGVDPTFDGSRRRVLPAQVKFDYK